MLVTQNIDGLHARAGTPPERLVELHGTNLLVECQTCHRRSDPEPHFESFRQTRRPPCCDCGGYDKPSRSVRMSADLWRQLSVMGSWIVDATVLRWAELTSEISQGAIKPSQVIDQLLSPPIEERDVHAARSVYEELTDKRCVWTDRTLRKEFDVDHAIPFALWRNNDLWNLLPAWPAVLWAIRKVPSRNLPSS